MRIKQTLVFIFLLLSLKSISQEKFVEVTVSDTLWVKPNKFVYAISTNPSAEYTPTDTNSSNERGSYEKDKLEMMNKQQLLIDSFKKVLIERGFYVLPAGIEDIYSTYDEPQHSNCMYIFTQSFDSVKMLYNFIVNNQFFYGGITSLRASNEDTYYKKLIQKLLSKAKHKANDIATLGNLKVGNIISIKEGQIEVSTGGWVAYPPLSSLARNGYDLTLSPESFAGTKQDTTDLYKIENTLVVRFAVQ